MSADCFSRGDIFALDEEIDWIIKLRWLQDLIKTETGIEIDDKEFISGAANLTDLLKKRWGNRRLHNGISLEELSQRILAWQSSWHQFDPQFPKESDYHIIEDCGLVKPLTIDGKAIDLSVEPYMDKAPMNPPNRSYSRKRVCDFLRKIGLESLFEFSWGRLGFCYSGLGDHTGRVALVNKVKSLKFRDEISFKDFLEKFPYDGQLHFYNPGRTDYFEVDEFIEWVESLIDFNE